jgi:outer membrane biosynthesis protein TonB
LLDKAAVTAVRQWEYAPLLLNGQPERFVLTVTVSFSLA